MATATDGPPSAGRAPSGPERLRHAEFYTAFSSSYSKTYGSLAGGIVLLLWLNYSAWAVLFGAELNAELDRRGSET